MQLQLKPWGNSQGVRLPRELLSSAGIKPDDILTAEVQDGAIILKKEFRHRTLRQRAEAYGGRLNLSEEVVWDEPKGNEVW
ncbi:MAG: AbrB/MazE/SpoVT family DNA-binding domain-containing protein [Clostridia bacterium]|nr:AbrB/MazE/SpoVT family DNA-binding domain-containing protein [Clostridia bacterium]